jgi:hypothetical protein
MVMSGLRAVFGLIGGIVYVVVMLVVEIAVTMALYIYLNLHHVETFGTLVRLSRNVLEVMVKGLESFLPGSANSAYATLFGELGPKSILLLLLGLVVAAVLRCIIGGIERLVGRRNHSVPA